ncbi:hypothetical protein [Rhodococcus xishaensis]|uniref:DUF4430 domain-containing protein n=1 Tax=Rhodococcus xishaensis TaxID=2487364 RepID=A0A3S3CQ64_9NOCA|nr:hypothetical protein [Rhodococcus xishaensis]RVW03040.1 hypothetical protein EGT50_10045 [Rhodococcus xishaensis]
MIKSVRAAATAALAAPFLAVAFAAPANAAPEDVTLTAEVQGNDLEVIITNNSEGQIDCAWMVTREGLPATSSLTSHKLDTLASYGLEVDPGDEVRDRWTFEDGSYLTAWYCYSLDTPETWGTGDWIYDVKTAEPISFTTPAATDGITGDGWHLAPDWLLPVVAAINAGSGLLGSS